MKISDTKIILIYGNSPIKGKIQDGNPSVIEKDINGDCPHYFYISEFIKTHLQDDKNFKKLLKFDNANSIFYEIQKLGHVVFAENTSDLKNKSGLIYLPEELTNNQKKTLTVLKDSFLKENYDLSVFFGLERTEDGIITGHQRMGKANILNEFLKDINKDKIISSDDNDLNK